MPKCTRCSLDLASDRFSIVAARGKVYKRKVCKSCTNGTRPPEPTFEITEDVQGLLAWLPDPLKPPIVFGIDRNAPLPIRTPARKKTTLVIGDIHFPYHHAAALRWVIELAKQLQPDRIVQVGDLKDQFSFSKFPKLVKQDPGSELEEAKKLATAFWADLRAAAPNAECYQLVGNHDSRALKRALEKAPELTELVGRSLRELYTYEGVKTIHDPAEELILDGVIFQHGHRSKLGDHARYNQRSTWCGHSHTGGVVFMRNLDGIYYEANAGFLGEVNTEAFAYHAQRRMNTCTLGVGIDDELGPRFCPFPGT